MVLRCDTNNITDMFPLTTYNVDDYCQSKWSVSHRQEWMSTYYWGKGIVLLTTKMIITIVIRYIYCY